MLDWGIATVGKIFRSNSSETEEQCQTGGTLPRLHCHFVTTSRVL